MRHRKKLNHLSRKSEHRNAMLANMAASLIVHKRITTTTAKAKALRIFVEPLITRSKEDSTHSRRMVFKDLPDKYAVAELFREVASRVADRPGGYTRIIKLDNRLGDNADMCIIELVDFNENLLTDKTAAKTKTSRRRRGIRKKESPEPVKGDVKMTGAKGVSDVEGTDNKGTVEAADSQVAEELTVAEDAEETTVTQDIEEAAVAEDSEEVTDAEVIEVEAGAEDTEETADAEATEETADAGDAEETADAGESEEVTGGEDTEDKPKS